MLIGNGMLINKVPLTLLGMHWNTQLQPGAEVGLTWPDNMGKLAAMPSGYYSPQGWMLPRTAGNLRAGLISGSGAVSSATMQSGYNIAATVTGEGGVTNAPLGLIISIAATLIASGGISSATTQALASMVATLTGSSSVTATAKGLADLGAALTGSGSVTANNTALMDIAATIRGYGDLTPEGIRDAIWNALSTSYNDDGTMGKLLNMAGSGGVDYAALAAAILAAAQTTPIHSNIKKVNDVTVTGTGATGDEWGP